MPEPQGDAPVAPDHDKTSFKRAGVNPGVAASSFDQTDNKGTAETAAQRTSQISKEAK